MISASIINGEKAPRAMRKAIAQVDSNLERTVLKLALKMMTLVKSKLSGDVLKVRTGRLRRSINYNLKKDGANVLATVGTNVIYARTHEFGITIPPHIVEVKNAKALSFNWHGNQVFAKRVNIPAVKMPKRSFLQASLDQMSDEIKKTIADETILGMKLAFVQGVK